MSEKTMEDRTAVSEPMFRHTNTVTASRFVGNMAETLEFKREQESDFDIDSTCAEGTSEESEAPSSNSERTESATVHNGGSAVEEVCE